VTKNDGTSITDERMHICVTKYQQNTEITHQ